MEAQQPALQISVRTLWYALPTHPSPTTTPKPQTVQVLRRDGDTLRAELAAQTVTVAKYKRMVGEISRLIDWAQCGLGRRAGEGAKPGLARCGWWGGVEGLTSAMGAPPPILRACRG